MEQQQEKLVDSLEKLSSKATKLNSLGWSFLRGVFFGLGSAVGAGVVAAVLWGILSWFLHSFENVPVLREMDRIEMRR